MLVSQLTAEVSQLRLKSQAQEASILQLRGEIAEQRNEFNTKFGQFISCANQYEQSKKAEIEGLQMQIAVMADKYKQLNEEYGKLKQKWHKPVGGTGVGDSQWKIWKWLEIYQWIVSLNEPRLKRYDQILYDSLQRDDANGRWLENVREEDLYYVGIKSFDDRQVLMHHINMLIHGLTYEPPPVIVLDSHSKNST